MSYRHSEWLNIYCVYIFQICKISDLASFPYNNTYVAQIPYWLNANSVNFIFFFGVVKNEIFLQLYKNW